jgi:hypothetical protein
MTPDSARYVKLGRFAELTGFTLETIELNIATGVWREGHEYRIAPDRQRLMDMEGYYPWVKSRALAGAAALAPRL